MAISKSTVISVQKLQVQVCEAMGLIPMTVRRIIIDLDAAKRYEPVSVYVQMVGDKDLLSLDWSEGLKGAEIIREPKKEATDSPRTGDVKFFCHECNDWRDTVESTAAHARCPICGAVMEKYS